jgi:hypothetical protein
MSTLHGHGHLHQRTDAVGIGLGSRKSALLSATSWGGMRRASRYSTGRQRQHHATQESGVPQGRQTLDTDVVNGQRRMSWLMVLDPPLA